MSAASGSDSHDDAEDLLRRLRTTQIHRSSAALAESRELLTQTVERSERVARRALGVLACAALMAGLLTVGGAVLADSAGIRSGAWRIMLVVFAGLATAALAASAVLVLSVLIAARQSAEYNEEKLVVSSFGVTVAEHELVVAARLLADRRRRVKVLDAKTRRLRWAHVSLAVAAVGTVATAAVLLPYGALGARPRPSASSYSKQTLETVVLASLSRRQVTELKRLGERLKTGGSPSDRHTGELVLKALSNGAGALGALADLASDSEDAGEKIVGTALGTFLSDGFAGASLAGSSGGNYVTIIGPKITLGSINLTIDASKLEGSKQHDDWYNKDADGKHRKASKCKEQKQGDGTGGGNRDSPTPAHELPYTP